MEAENLNLNAVIEQVGREKNIERDVLVEALTSAMLTAARKKLGLTADLEAQYNEELGEVEVFEFRKIVKDVMNPSIEVSFADAQAMDPDLQEDAIGDDIGVKVDSKEFGRIAAMTAKQVIIQRVREAERATIFGDFKDRKGDLVTGIVRRFERGNVIVDLGRAEAVMPMREQVQRENVRAGDRVVAYVTDVLEIARGPQIILSRTHSSLVVKLFEQEVPEIGEGIVVIEVAAREAGVRTKIAVRSLDSSVDPVGACVGPKGARVQAVIQELRGEKIDIVAWNEDDARFVCNALSPAEVTRVLVNEEEHSMQIVVPDDQLSLAIGRRGQNVRLAAQLSGWKIDITSETKVAEEKEVAWASLNRIEGLSEILVQTLYNHGFRAAKDVLEAEDEFLASLPGFSEEAVPRVKDGASKVVEIEAEEKKQLEVKARDDANVLLTIDRAGDDAADGAERLKGLAGMAPSLAATLMENLYDAPEDLYFEEGVERLVGLVGLSAGKARQVKFAVAEHINKLTNGVAPVNEKPLSEPELRDAEQYDEFVTSAASEAPEGGDESVADPSATAEMAPESNETASAPV